MLSEVDRLEARIEELEIERNHWREEAQRNSDARTCVLLRHGFQLTTGEAFILGKLYAAQGQVVRSDRIDEDMPGRNWEERSEAGNTTQVLICRIRKRLGAHAVITHRGHGYSLSPAALAGCKQLLIGS